MPKLSELTGWAENAPGKKESEHMECWQFDENYCYYHQDTFDEEKEGMHPLGKQGYNTALSQVSELHEEVDVEKMAKFLNDNNAKWYEQCQYEGEPDLGTLMATALASTMKDWLRITKGETP